MLTAVFTAGEPATRPEGLLQLQGTATIEFCNQLRQALSDALERSPGLVVDVSMISEIDVAALQLFCSARRSAFGRKKSITLAKGISDAFAAAVLDTGFNRTHTSNCAQTAGQPCLWGACTSDCGAQHV